MENCVDINIEIDVVTGQTVANIVTSILEFLLYQRHQIPFVCKTFKYLVSRWDKDAANEIEDAPANFQLEREKTLAKQTIDGIKSMTEVVKKAFEQSDVSCVRFLFGSTAVTPKEAYIINVPAISRIHSYEHHKLKDSLVNQALISLPTTDSLYNTFSTNLGVTNVFLELQMLDIDANGWEQVFSTDLCDLPSNCKQVVINLVHTLPADYVEAKCCGELTVFQDIANLSLQSNNESISCKDLSKKYGWWEASTIVRGFKQKSLKGSKLWQ